MYPTFDHKLATDLSCLSIENKPEAPWIKRHENQAGTIILTDQMLQDESVRLDTEE